MAELGEGTSASIDQTDQCGCTETGDPVDVAIGRVIARAKDFSFPDPFGLDILRIYSSDKKDKKGVFGYGWFSLLDLKIELFPENIDFQDSEGREIWMPLIKKGQTFNFESESITINREEEKIRLTKPYGVTYHFEVDSDCSEGKLAAITNAYGNKIEFLYDNKSLNRIIDARENVYKIVWNSRDRLRKICISDTKRLYEYIYDDKGRLISVKDELANTLAYQYDKKNRLIKKRDKNGFSAYYEYDDKDRCIKSYTDNGMFSRQIKYIVDGPAQIAKVTDSLGAATQYYSMPSGMVGLIKDPLGQIKHRAFNTKRKIIGTVDKNRNTITYEYNRNGYETQRIDEENREFRKEHNSDGTVLEIDPLKNRIIKTYDSKGRVIKVQDQETGDFLKYSPKDGHRFIERKVVRRTNLDRDGQNIEIVEEVDSVGNRWLKEYDAPGRLIKKVDPLGYSTRFEYDAKSRIIKETKANLGSKIFEYDPENNLIKEGDSAGNCKEYQYMDPGIRILEKDENGHIVKFGYNTEGRLTLLTNQNKEEHSFEYDSLNRLTKDTGLSGEVRKYSYDPKGNVTKTIMPDRSIFKYDYDMSGLLLKIETKNEIGNIDNKIFKYDDACRLIEVSNNRARVQIEYDALNRIVSERLSDWGIDRSYDIKGNYIIRRTGYGSEVQFGYDEAGELTTVFLPDKSKIECKRDSGARPVKIQYPSALTTSFEYKGLKLTTQIIKEDNYKNPLENRKYFYDLSNRLKREESRNLYYNYEYDKAGRLLKLWTNNHGESIFKYDAAGNIIEKKDKAGKHKALYLSGNRINSFGKTFYKYDKMGRIILKTTPKGDYSYKYDLFGNLIAVYLPDGNKVEYEYDAIGRRICKRIIGVSEIYYLWDQLQLAAEIKDGIVTEHLFYPDGFVPIASIRGDEAWFYHTDLIGRVREVTDKNNLVVWRSDYEPFGVCHTFRDPICFNESSGYESLFRFQGHYFDQETGLHYNMFRYYDPEIGRYLTPDPIGYLGGDYNLYCYARNDPVNKVDPIGLFLGGLVPLVGAAIVIGAVIYLLTRPSTPDFTEGAAVDSCPEGEKKEGCKQQPKKEPLCKIEIRANKIGTFWYHLYIVFTDIEGKEYYLRGGPSDDGPQNSSGLTSELSGGSSNLGSVKLSGSGSNPKASNSSNDNEQGPYGNIVTEYGEYTMSTVDWDPNAKSALISSGPNICNKYKELTKQMDAIENSRIRYSPLGPNSNSVVFTALKNIGLNPKVHEDVLAPGATTPMKIDKRSSSNY